VRVAGDLDGANRTRHYITVRGFERTLGDEVYVLWDGIMGTGTPGIVMIQLVDSGRGIHQTLMNK